jgi:bifunctional UDP-N-acetylglucosamine pyrophosphorylase/glucosamine-1-phosphate N-acetyltransferase
MAHTRRFHQTAHESFSMPRAPLAAVILAAGQGKRMKSRLSKVLHPVGGKAMVRHVVDGALALKCERVVVVIAPAQDKVAAAIAPARTAVQDRPRGTADAVKAALPELRGFRGDVLILCGDVPLISPETLRALVRARRVRSNPAVVVLGFRPADPAAYGRLVTGPRGELERIVEFRDASAAERAIGLCNAGAYAVDGAVLADYLSRIRADNAQGEFYLTDLVAMARAAGRSVAFVEGRAEDALGINSRADLALVERVFQDQRRRAAMAGGVTLLDPDTVWFSHDTRLGSDVTIEPNVVFGPGVTVGDNVRINAFCHFEQARIAAGAIVGPFARLRPGADIGPDAHIGNFVEVKNTRVGAGAKANHLTYLGDAVVGPKANVGAGTITCNYDGFLKHRTEIGAGAFIGSNSSLVAPVKVGRGAITGAGSVITADIPADALAVARGRQEVRKGWAKAFRERQAAKKEKR